MLSTYSLDINSTGRKEIQLEEGVVGLSICVVTDNSIWITMAVYDQSLTLRGQIVANRAKEKLYITSDPNTTSFSCVPGVIDSGVWYFDYQVASREMDASVEIEVETYSDRDLLPVHENEHWLLEEQNLSLIPLLERMEESLSDEPATWYFGDFHTHTIASDGQMTMTENQISASKMDLDFYVATDHNIVPTQWAPGDPVVFPGIEVTSTLGHFNLLFVEDFVFNQFVIHDMEDPDKLLVLIKVYKEKALFSVNHPFLTVWKWLLHDLPLEWIASIELINDPTYQANKLATHQALLFWDVLLNDGHMITGIGGSDSHLKPDDVYPGSVLPSLIGDPKTAVFADSLAPNALKEGIIAGKVNITRFGNIDVEYNGYLPGEKRAYQELIDDPSIHVKVVYTVDKVANYAIDPTIQLIHNGDIAEEWRSSQVDITHYVALSVKNQYDWFRVQIINSDNEVLAISNPIFYGSKEPSYKLWGDVLKDVPDTTPDA